MPTLTGSLRAFRIILPLFLLVHGITRIANGTVGGFGEFLSGIGFPLGPYLAWAITIFEILGSISLIAGYFVPLIATLFAFELLTGIVLVHKANGWFVVGGGSGGMEYSVLLTVCFIFLAVTSKREKF